MKLKNWHMLAILGAIAYLLYASKKSESEPNQVGSSSETPNISIDNPAANAIRNKRDLYSPAVYREDVAISNNPKLANNWTGLTRARRGGTLDVTRYGPLAPGVVRVIK